MQDSSLSHGNKNLKSMESSYFTNKSWYLDLETTFLKKPSAEPSDAQGIVKLKLNECWVGIL